MNKHVAWVVIVGSLSSGCMSAADTARRYAVADLRCPIANIQMHEIAQGAFVATGCGRHSFYIDNNAPAQQPTPHTPGTSYVTLAADSR